MKKVISIILLLAMCIACFAGCAEEKKEDATLNAAKEYLYTMYKDAEEKTAVDYTVVSQVRIDNVTYPITWTTNVSEDKVKITAGENNMTMIDINEATLEQIDYELTATMKNAEGLEVSVSFKHFIPKADGLPATLADGTYVILAGDLTMSSLAADKGYGYPTATKVTVANGKVSGHVAADVLTIKNVEGGFTIQDAQGRYFYLKGTYNSFNVSAEAPAEGHIFSILVKDGKFLIQNAMNKKTLAYSTSYSSWGCYPELTGDHVSLVDIIAATAPAEDPTPAPTPDPDPAPTPDSKPTPDPAPTTGWTQVSSLNDGDKIVIVNPASKMALSMTKTGFYNVGVDISGGFGSISNEEIFVVKKNSDGTWSFTSESGKKLALADEFNSLNDTGANVAWEISDAGDGCVYLKNIKRDVYLDWYSSKSNWSTYKPDSLGADYVLALYKQA